MASPPRGLTAIGIFLFFGVAMACLAGTTLVWRGTLLDSIWTLNPNAHAQLGSLGHWVGYGFFLLAIALAVAGEGWLKRRFWGWVLAVIIISTQVAGDLVNLSMGDVLRGAMGALIAGALLIYMTSPGIRGWFPRKDTRAGALK